MSVKKVAIGDFITELASWQKKNENCHSIGYSHGYSRALSNQGRVLVNGHRCIVVGSVNMNMMTIDVTN
jgi:alanine racemase